MFEFVVCPHSILDCYIVGRREYFSVRGTEGVFLGAIDTHISSLVKTYLHVHHMLMRQAPTAMPLLHQRVVICGGACMAAGQYCGRRQRCRNIYLR